MSKFYDEITKDTIRDEINRICGTTDAVYSLRDKLARTNHALDKYWQLASESAPRGTLDDTNNSSIPIETQSLVSGTNAYKISDFTNKVLQILKVSVLDDDGIEHDLQREEFDELRDLIEIYDTADTGLPGHYAILGDYIYLRLCPDYNETDGLRCYVNRELSKLAYVSYTPANAANTLGLTAHGLSDGDTVLLSTAGVMPNGWTADTTVYYVRDKAADTFKIATTESGTAVTISDDGTGTQKYVHISKTPGIPVIHHDYLARQASLQFLIEKKLPQMNGIAQQIFADERDIQDYWANRDKEIRTKILTKQRAFK